MLSLTLKCDTHPIPLRNPQSISDISDSLYSFSSGYSVGVSKRQREGGIGTPVFLLLSPCEENISLSRNYFANPNGEIVRKSVRNVVSKFEDDPTVNESWIAVLLRQVQLYAGKNRGSWNRKRGTRIWEQERVWKHTVIIKMT